MCNMQLKVHFGKSLKCSTHHSLITEKLPFKVIFKIAMIFIKMPFQESDRQSKCPKVVLDCHLVFQHGAAQNIHRRFSHIHNMQTTVNIKMSPYVLNPERLKTNVNKCKNQGSPSTQKQDRLYIPSIFNTCHYLP